VCITQILDLVHNFHIMKRTTGLLQFSAKFSSIHTRNAAVCYIALASTVLYFFTTVANCTFSEQPVPILLFSSFTTCSYMHCNVYYKYYITGKHVEMQQIICCLCTHSFTITLHEFVWCGTWNYILLSGTLRKVRNRHNECLIAVHTKACSVEVHSPKQCLGI
jgi:hypothetical protein